MRVVRLKNATIAAVADGHGDSSCLFADVGADLATKAACEVLRKNLKEQEGKPAVFWNSRRTETAQDVKKTFSRLVLEDCQTRYPEFFELGEYPALKSYVEKLYCQLDEPLSPEQIRVRYRHLMQCRDRIHALLHLYGTTVRASLLTKDYIFSFALGDGDTVAITEGNVEWIIPQSEVYACETDSLCDDPERMEMEFLFSFAEVKTEDGERKKGLSDLRLENPILLLSTDGFRNAFISDRLFCDKVREIGALAEDGKNRSVTKKLKRLFDKLSMGSVYQDDISMVLLSFSDAE